jgi:hypothetical protein
MPVEQIKKEQEGRGEVPLISNKEFADFLVKEFKMPAGKAKETAFRYSQEKKEMAVLLKEWVPNASFKGIEYLLSEKCSHASIAEDLRILDAHGIPPSRELLKTSPITLKANIQALKQRGRNVAEYARLKHLGDEPKKFNKLLDYEEAIIKTLETKLPNVSPEAIIKSVNKTKLGVTKRFVRDAELQGRKLVEFSDSDIETFGFSREERSNIARKELAAMLSEKMHKVPPESIKEFVGKTPRYMITLRLKALERRGIDISEVTTMQEFVDITSLPAEEFGTVFGKVPPKLKFKFLAGGPYCFADGAKFKYFLDKKPQKRRGRLVGLHPSEREAFKEMEEIMDKKGKINGDEVKTIYNGHMGYSDATQHRLDEIVFLLIEHGAWKKWEETAEKKR